MVSVINATSEPVSEVNGFHIQPSGFVAKARDRWKIHRNPPGVPIGTPRKVDHWVETNLPAPMQGVYYIVDNDVYNKLKSKRSDVL